MIGGAMVIGLAHMTLADATVILFAGPFAVVALSGYVLKERVSLMSWIGVALGFLAVILVARPGLGAFTPYVIFPIIAAVFYAVFQLLSRHLAMAGEDANGTLAWTLGIGLLLAIPLALWEWRALDAAAWGLSFALAMAFAAAHLFIVRAYDLALANVLAPFSYVQIAAAVLFGIIAFDALPDAWTLAGILLIVIAAALVIKESRQASG
jgi:drug/metabolite transporter (DMT)-like permease